MRCPKRRRAMLDLPGGGAGRQGMQLRALLAGIGPRLVKRSLQTALLWTMYEEVYRRWRRAATHVHGAP